MHMQLIGTCLLEYPPEAGEVIAQLCAQAMQYRIVKAVALLQQGNAPDQPQGIGVFCQTVGRHQRLASNSLLRLLNGHALDLGLGMQLLLPQGVTLIAIRPGKKNKKQGEQNDPGYQQGTLIASQINPGHWPVSPLKVLVFYRFTDYCTNGRHLH